MTWCFSLIILYRHARYLALGDCADDCPGDILVRCGWIERRERYEYLHDGFGGAVVYRRHMLAVHCLALGHEALRAGNPISLPLNGGEFLGVRHRE